jgi:hypothetical protein
LRWAQHISKDRSGVGERMNRFVIPVWCALMLSMSACTSTGNPRTLFSYIPSTSYAVLAVNWTAVSKDPDLKRISKGAEVEKLFEQLGVDGETVSEFAVFGDSGGPKASKGLIAKGSFNSYEIIRELEVRGWIEQDFEGQRIYVNPGDASWLTTLDKNLFVLGTESGVKAAIGAKTKTENRFTSNPAYKALSSHFEGKQYPILMMVALPQGSQDMANAAVLLTATAMDLAGVGPLGDLLSKIGYAKGLGCAIWHKGESFPVAVSAVMKDDESAKLVAGALDMLRKLGGIISKNYAPHTDANAARAIQTMSVERNGEVVSVKMTMSRRDLGATNR